MIFNWAKWCIIRQQILNQDSSNGLNYRKCLKSRICDSWGNETGRSCGCFCTTGCCCTPIVAMWSLFSMIHDSFPASFTIPHTLPKPVASIYQSPGKGKRNREKGTPVDPFHTRHFPHTCHNSHHPSGPSPNNATQLVFPNTPLLTHAFPTLHITSCAFPNTLPNPIYAVCPICYSWPACVVHFTIIPRQPSQPIYVINPYMSYMASHKYPLTNAIPMHALLDPCSIPYTQVQHPLHTAMTLPCILLVLGYHHLAHSTWST